MARKMTTIEAVNYYREVSREDVPPNLSKWIQYLLKIELHKLDEEIAENCDKYSRYSPTREE